MKLLSTKIVSKKFKDLLIKNNYQIEEKSFIKILPFKSKSNISILENIIFTSKNAVKIILRNSIIKNNLANKNIYCVGKSTAELIKKNNLNLIKSEDNSKNLSKFILANFKNSKNSFTYFSGKKRIRELENNLKKNNINIIVHEVYDTLLTPIKINDLYKSLNEIQRVGKKSNRGRADTQYRRITPTTQKLSGFGRPTDTDSAIHADTSGV